MKSIKKMSKYKPMSHFFHMTFGCADVPSGLHVTAESLKPPKLFNYIKNMKAALLTSLIDSPSIWRKKQLCSSSAFH